MKAHTAILLGLVVCSSSQSACIEHAQTEVSYAAWAVPKSPPPIQAAEWTVSLRIARIAFGPTYFCAASTGIDRCEPAQAELLTTSTINLLDPRPQPLGVARGVTGSIRSATFDFGVTWFATQAAAAVAPGNALGHSAYFEGEARRGADLVQFAAIVDLAPQFRGQHAVVSSPALGLVSERTTRLDVTIDYGDWLSQIDFAKATAGEVFRIEPNTPAHTGIVQGMTARRPLQFQWSP